ncbi:hypothetical protein [Novosphingobium sp. Fuku2-ISO-50]|uniref:hypothetical protein n=1 Tax=Novosphingobium sp. Fuku2-ISO-50 TaxID=1739114 RepID=UPI001E4A6C8B|nr:hypothetical protein [Novosphingobium sp. Fuku2-ISO-50]
MAERILGQARADRALRRGGGDSAALDTAHAAMAAGCRFLIVRGLTVQGPESAIRPNIRLRRVGNCLNELDRFLSVLITECVRAAGLAPDGPADGADDFPRRLDTARRLRRIEAHCGYFSAATTRLRAIGRIREMACGDGLLRPGAWLERDMAVATAGAEFVPGQPTKAPEISDQALAAIAEFYVSIADRLHVFFAATAAEA